MAIKGGKEGGVDDFSGLSELTLVGTGGKARISLLGLKMGLEALDGTTGFLVATEGGEIMSSGEAKGGLDGLLVGD